MHNNLTYIKGLTCTLHNWPNVPKYPTSTMIKRAQIPTVTCIKDLTCWLRSLSKRNQRTLSQNLKTVALQYNSYIVYTVYGKYGQVFNSCQRPRTGEAFLLFQPRLTSISLFLYLSLSHTLFLSPCLSPPCTPACSLSLFPFYNFPFLNFLLVYFFIPANSHMLSLYFSISVCISTLFTLFFLSQLLTVQLYSTAKSMYI